MPLGTLRNIESHAVSVRKVFKVPLDQPFDPYTFAKELGIDVIEDLQEIEGLDAMDLHILLEVYSDKWSGGGVQVGPEKRVVILNSMHNKVRKRATLMEEVCHFLLNHEPSTFSTYRGTELAFRNYNREQEKEAYFLGAAILVPYTLLGELVDQKKTAAEIGGRFEVSEELVKFRIKITGLWNKYLKSG